AALAALPSRAASWPDLSQASKASGAGKRDAAVIVAVEDYLAVAKVAGADANADDWHAYLTETLQVPADKVALLRGGDATLEKMRKYAAQAAAQVEPGGTLWFVFIGHGAPSKDGNDGLLVGADAQGDADSLYARSLPRAELLDLIAKGRQARAVVLIDACFSGRSREGEALVAGLQPLIVMRDAPGRSDGRAIVLTAAKADQFAGPLPKAPRPRPAFSYLALGALRGWAADADGRVTAGALVDFARRALSLDKGRTQTPELTAGAPDAVLGVGREPGPDLAKIDREARGPLFQVTSPGRVAAAVAPAAFDAAAGGVRWADLDIDALERFNIITKLDKGEDAPEDKAAAWRRFAQDSPKYAELAGARAAEWDAYASRLRAAEEAKQDRRAARDGDWEKLGRLLVLDVVPPEDKKEFAAQFLKAYAVDPGLEPVMAGPLLPYAATPAMSERLRALARAAQGEHAPTLAALVMLNLRGQADYKTLKAFYDSRKDRTGWAASDEGKAAIARLRRLRLDAAATRVVTAPRIALRYAVRGQPVTDAGIIVADLDSDPDYRAFIVNAVATNILSDPMDPALKAALDAFQREQGAAK
ncbi:MAG: caspase family protein, partial [Elusimicrobia bacterium]|nr:caspase family protein [Elusimicrobiota bacterium]